jgi:hypothetical protein
MSVDHDGRNGQRLCQQELALIETGSIAPFEPRFERSCRRETFARLERLDLEGDEPVKGDLVFGEKFERVLFGKGCRCLLGENGIAVEQDNASLEVALGFEVRVARRFERLDESDLLDGNKALADRDDVHGYLPGWLRWSSFYRDNALPGLGMAGNGDEAFGNLA